MSAAIYPVGVELVPYVIVGPDGTRAAFNDLTDPDYVGIATDVTGLERAGVREAADSLPEADGGVHGPFRRDRLAFTVQGLIPPDAPGDSWIGRQDRLLRATDAMTADAELQWSPSAGPTIDVEPIPLRFRFREQQATRITRTSGQRAKSFVVAGVGERSTVEALYPTVVSIVPDTSAGLSGLLSPLESPLESLAAPPAAALVTNRGRSNAWPVITFYGPWTNPYITNLTVGKTLAIADVIPAGSSLVIDTNPSRRSVLLNGVTNRYGSLDFDASLWWALAGGVNDVRLGATTFGAGATCELLYRDAWG